MSGAGGGGFRTEWEGGWRGRGLVVGSRGWRRWGGGHILHRSSCYLHWSWGEKCNYNCGVMTTTLITYFISAQLLYIYIIITYVYVISHTYILKWGHGLVLIAPNTCFTQGLYLSQGGPAGLLSHPGNKATGGCISCLRRNYSWETSTTYLYCARCMYFPPSLPRSSRTTVNQLRPLSLLTFLPPAALARRPASPAILH